MSLLDNTSTPGEQPIDETQSGQEQAQQEEQPQYLTRKELDALLQQREDQLMKRVQQSSRDRQALVQKQLDEMKGMLAGSVEVTPEMEKKMRTQIESRLDGTSQDTQADAGPQAQAAKMVFDETQEIFRTEALDVTEKDPEWKLIQAALDDPNGNMTKYRREVFKAVAAKRERIQSSDETAAARVGQGKGGPARAGDISNINDTETLYKMGEEKIRSGRK